MGHVRGTVRTAVAGVAAACVAATGCVTAASGSVGASAAAAAPDVVRAGSTAGVTRWAPSSCYLTVGAVDRAGGYVERGVDLRKGVSTTSLQHAGLFPAGATTALSSSERFGTDLAGDQGWIEFRHLSAVVGGRLVTAKLEQTTGVPGTPDGSRSKIVASVRGWAAFRQLVASDYSVQTKDFKVVGARLRLYGLTRAGVLYRYNGSMALGGPQIWRGAGKVAGFGAVRSITLIGQNATSDVLLANTTTGSLLTIRVTVNGTMRTTATRLRDRGWNGLEHLVADRCNMVDRVPTTGLVGIDADTGTAYGYRLGFATGRRTTITPVGRIGSGWTDAAYANQWFDVSGRPLRGA